MAKKSFPLSKVYGLWPARAPFIEECYANPGCRVVDTDLVTVY